MSLGFFILNISTGLQNYILRTYIPGASEVGCPSQHLRDPPGVERGPLIWETYALQTTFRHARYKNGMRFEAWYLRLCVSTAKACHDLICSSLKPQPVWAVRQFGLLQPESSVSLDFSEIRILTSAVVLFHICRLLIQLDWYLPLFMVYSVTLTSVLFRENFWIFFLDINRNCQPQYK